MVRLIPQTKLSIALDLHPDVLTYVIGLNPHEFERLRNPLMRKLMPPRITLARLAAMTNMSITELLAGIYSAAHIEFEQEEIEQLPPHAVQASASIPPEWVSNAVAAVVDLLEADERLDTDPFVPLFPALKRAAVGDVILMKHKWEPQPLFDVWSKLGVEFYSVQQSNTEWWIYLRKGRESFRAKG